MATAADTIERFLGLKRMQQRVDYTVTVNFDGFEAIVNALGGIDVDVPFRIVDNEYPTPDFGTRRVVFEAGHQHLDGGRALEYARTRHADSDFGRGQRQQQVLAAMSSTLRARPLLLRPWFALRAINAASGAVQTTFPVGRLDAWLLAIQLARLDSGHIQQFRLSPDTAGVIDEGSDLRWNAGDVQQLVGRWLLPPTVTEEQAHIQVLNGTGVAGLAGQVTTTLGGSQFSMLPPADTAATRTSHILVGGSYPQALRRLQDRFPHMPVKAAPTGVAASGADLIVVLGDDYERWVKP
ncbi:MAG: hypothetical protein NVSMB42_06290 [Herpetosiphon sp.]